MRVTALGKITILILVIGIAMGGMKWWQKQQGGSNSSGGSANTGGKGGFKFPDMHLPKLPGTDNSGSGANAGGGSAGDIELVSSATKKGWLLDEIGKFNQAHEGQWRITFKPIETREAMHAILEGKEHPVLWSPSSVVWANRLAEAWSDKNHNTVLDTGDTSNYRVILRTPIVFLTTKQKANFLRPLLESPQSWTAIRDLSLRRRRVPWGAFKFAHADPLNANSGMLTIGLILADYGRRTGQLGSLGRVSNSGPFLTFLQELEKGMVYDSAVEKGSSALTQAFAQDVARYDFITTYESSALEVAANNPELTVIYPNPTAVSENAVGVLSGNWVSDAQREGARAFLNFLTTKESVQDGLKYHFRPAQSGGSLSLNDELSRYAAQGFQQSYTSIELPSYEALNGAIYKWRLYVAHKPMT